MSKYLFVVMCIVWCHMHYTVDSIRLQVFVDMQNSKIFDCDGTLQIGDKIRIDMQSLDQPCHCVLFHNRDNRLLSNMMINIYTLNFENKLFKYSDWVNNPRDGAPNVFITMTAEGVNDRGFSLSFGKTHEGNGEILYMNTGIMAMTNVQPNASLSCQPNSYPLHLLPSTTSTASTTTTRVAQTTITTSTMVAPTTTTTSTTVAPTTTTTSTMVATTSTTTSTTVAPTTTTTIPQTTTVPSTTSSSSTATSTARNTETTTEFKTTTLPTANHVTMTTTTIKTAPSTEDVKSTSEGTSSTSTTEKPSTSTLTSTSQMPKAVKPSVISHITTKSTLMTHTTTKLPITTKMIGENPSNVPFTIKTTSKVDNISQDSTSVFWTADPVTKKTEPEEGEKLKILTIGLIALAICVFLTIVGVVILTLLLVRKHKRKEAGGYREREPLNGLELNESHIQGKKQNNTLSNYTEKILDFGLLGKSPDSTIQSISHTDQTSALVNNNQYSDSVNDDSFADYVNGHVKNMPGSMSSSSDVAHIVPVPQHRINKGKGHYV